MAKQPIKKTNNNKLIVGGVTLAIVIALVMTKVAWKGILVFCLSAFVLLAFLV